MKYNIKNISSALAAFKVPNVFFLLFAVAATSSAEINFDRAGALSLTAALAESGALLPSAPAPSGPARAVNGAAEWTIMVFMNAKNNLEPQALADLNEMELVGSTDRLNIVVEVGRMAGFDESEGDWRGTRRYFISKDTDTARLTSPMVADLGKVDMGDYKNLADFGRWAKKTYPAKKYMLIVWNHGSGWITSEPVERPFAKGISYDDETKNHINTQQLAKALKKMGKVDIYASDACLMQMVEVDYQLKDLADFIVGSEESEPGEGYQYTSFLAPVAARPEMTPEELARGAVDAFADYYTPRRYGTTQSVVRTAALEEFLELADNFVKAVMRSGERELVKNARDAAQRYAKKDNKDLYDFVSRISAQTKNGQVRAQSLALMEHVVNRLVVHNRTTMDSGFDYASSRGIAVYIPSGKISDNYLDLSWCRRSAWYNLLFWLNPQAQPQNNDFPVVHGINIGH